MFEFKTRNGEVLKGKLVYQYPAFEGGMKYIFDVNGRLYRCVKLDGQFVEYVA